MVDFAVSVENRVKLKESEKKDRYLIIITMYLENGQRATNLQIINHLM